MKLRKKPRCVKCGSMVVVSPGGVRTDGTNRPCEVLCACRSGSNRKVIRRVWVS